MATDATKLSGEVETRIRDALTPLHPEQVILFGSYAWGRPTQDSDIDLYVVTQDDFVPATWRQKRDIVRAVSNRILDLRTRYAIDLLVHTKPMHRKFVEIDSSFARRIMNEGVRLL
ncbi:MAG TPA: nucleotidyltransferase domain-containing protein [Sedimentisphaerales bacterium]|nr:nucleotidyltransferase domain-containing protein [Sedimentisphaerales bacterium]HRS12399.1 nucleotidyltransferase domain-containing protein [Sedimentisphaerales bacterium]HRV48959.1 nucleotidyltransferase domain-containing protein [Sedimentisphaerales bacterium]